MPTGVSVTFTGPGNSPGIVHRGSGLDIYVDKTLRCTGGYSQLAWRSSRAVVEDGVILVRHNPIRQTFRP
jgi:hypothetical protein